MAQLQEKQAQSTVTSLELTSEQDPKQFDVDVNLASSQITAVSSRLALTSVGLRLLKIAIDVAVVSLAAHALAVYRASRNISYGINTQDYRLEPTGNEPVWPTNIVLEPSYIIVAGASADLCLSLMLLVMDFWNGRKLVDVRILGTMDGLCACVLLVLITAFGITSTRNKHSLGWYSCDNSHSDLDVVAHFSEVCHAQITTFSLSLAALFLEIAILSCLVVWQIYPLRCLSARKRLGTIDKI